MYISCYSFRMTLRFNFIKRANMFQLFDTMYFLLDHYKLCINISCTHIIQQNPIRCKRIFICLRSTPTFFNYIIGLSIMIRFYFIRIIFCQNLITRNLWQRKMAQKQVKVISLEISRCSLSFLNIRSFHLPSHSFSVQMK